VLSSSATALLEAAFVAAALVEAALVVVAALLLVGAVGVFLRLIASCRRSTSRLRAAKGSRRPDNGIK